MKEVNTQNYWSFELGTPVEINILTWIIVGFQQRDRQYSQNLNKNTFYRSPVTSAQWILGTENYPDNSMLLIYDDDDYSQRYGKIKEVFKALTKDAILQPYISERDLYLLTMVII